MVNMYDELYKLTDYYFDNFEKKNILALSDMFDDEIFLFDPIIKRVNGKANVINVNKRIFDSCNKIKFTKKEIFIDQRKMIATGEVEFFCDEKKINVVDIIAYSESLKIISIKAYLDTKGLS
tara:strand:- start:3152 stop:3517 length:366 start_codon:yes stop_codon:yes gene_type:complete